MNLYFDMFGLGFHIIFGAFNRKMTKFGAIKVRLFYKTKGLNLCNIEFK